MSMALENVAVEPWSHARLSFPVTLVFDTRYHSKYICFVHHYSLYVNYLILNHPQNMGVEYEKKKNKKLPASPGKNNKPPTGSPVGS